MPVDLCPDLIDYHTRTIECTPYNEVPARSMPQATQQHRDKRVDIARCGLVFDLFAEYLAVAAQRDIQIALEPTAKRHVPTAPKLLRVA